MTLLTRVYILFAVQNPCTIQLVSLFEWSDVVGVVDCPVVVEQEYPSDQVLSFLQPLHMSNELVMYCIMKEEVMVVQVT